MKDSLEIKSNKHLKLVDIPTRSKPKYHSDEGYKTLLGSRRARLEKFQSLLYAAHQRAVLVIFQGMDTAGKDGAVKHVMSGVNPQGCSVVGFKAPSPNELSHDFLWRVNSVLPARGQIGIFNRSYYEEVLVTRVHPELIRQERLPGKTETDGTFWKFRYRDIVNYEKYLHRQGYEIIKVFIHISKEEQKRRLLERFRDPKKLWKISESDIRERSFWKDYQHAYEECIRHTTSKSSPWYVVPGDDKESARLAISEILIKRLEKLKLRHPKLDAVQVDQLKKLKSLLTNE